MPKTYQNVLDEARVLLQDTDSESYRLTDAQLIPMFNRALQELNRIRPDAFFDVFLDDDVDTTVPEVTDANLATVFPLPMMFYHPVVYFVVGSAELIEDEFATDGRAVTLLAGFRQSILAL